MTTALSTKSRLLVLGLALVGGAIALALTIAGGPGPKPAAAASHREAPAISLDAPADITDFFMFRSYETGKSDKVVLLMDVMSEEPSSGPNYWNFDPNVVYVFHVDNDRDGKADDVSFEFRFKTEIRGTARALGLFNPYIGGAGGLPPILTLDDPGIGLRQKYTVTMVSGEGDDDDDDDGHRQVLAKGLIAVPSNVGPRTMPNYDALAAQGIFSNANSALPPGVRVFAGQRQDPFYIDLGAVFDTLNLRRPVPALLPGPTEEGNDNVNPFGTDMLSGFNVSTIGLEVPSTLLTGTMGTTTLGAYASTSRPGISVYGHGDGDDDDDDGLRQVQRLANPLINETIIGVADKDRWNALEPHQEARFLDYYLNPRLALELQLVFGVPAGTSGRTDLRDLLLKYQPTDTRLSELLRLNLNVMPTPLAAQRRMTVLATPSDPAGWPNGRRPKDDVTDIAVRVIGGPNYIAANIGDGVNTDDVANTAAFPFIGTPWDGRDRQHDNP